MELQGNWAQVLNTTGVDPPRGSAVPVLASFPGRLPRYRDSDDHQQLQAYILPR